MSAALPVTLSSVSAHERTWRASANSGRSGVAVFALAARCRLRGGATVLRGTSWSLPQVRSAAVSSGTAANRSASSP